MYRNMYIEYTCIYKFIFTCEQYSVKNNYLKHVIDVKDDSIEY